MRQAKRWLTDGWLQPDHPALSTAGTTVRARDWIMDGHGNVADCQTGRPPGSRIDGDAAIGDWAGSVACHQRRGVGSSG